MEEKERETQAWIEEILKSKFSDRLGVVLHDSKVLCRVLNEVIPDIIPESHYNMDPIPDFKCLENIGLFVEECRKLGVRDNYLFISMDLFEEKNIELVCDCVLQLKKIVQSKNFKNTRAKYKRKRERERMARTQGNGLGILVSGVSLVGGLFRWTLSAVRTSGNYLVHPLFVGIAIGCGVKFGRTCFLILAGRNGS